MTGFDTVIDRRGTRGVISKDIASRSRRCSAC